MLDRLLNLYRGVVGHVVVVVGPTFAADVERHLRMQGAADVEIAVQRSPTGMLDAILLGLPAAERDGPSSVWVTWCDQVAVHHRTIERLAERTLPDHSDALVLPTAIRSDPYIHLERDESGRIVRIRHRREGDAMPEIGESDMGLFAMSPRGYADLLPQFAADGEIGRGTGERNFLPFIPWVAARARVATFPCEDPSEAVGINTPEELALVERYLERG